MAVKDILRSLFVDRRKNSKPVENERRKSRTELHEKNRELVEAIEGLKNATQKFESRVANDPQQVVLFHTFQMICKHNLEAGEHRLCRHKGHEAANTGIARCDEHLCPVMMGKAS